MSYSPSNPSDILPNGGDRTRGNADGTIHETIYDRDRNERISWDHDRSGNYIPGSGHTVDQNDPDPHPKWWDK